MGIGPVFAVPKLLERNNLTEGLVILDRQGEIESANPAARRLLDVSEPEDLETLARVLLAASALYLGV